MIVPNKGTLDLTPWCIHKSETYKTGDLKDYEVDYEYSILEGSGSIIGSTFRAKGDIGATTKIAITAKIGDVEIATTHILVQVVEETQETDEADGNEDFPPAPTEDPILKLSSVSGIDGYCYTIETIDELKSKINEVLDNIKTKLITSYPDEHLVNDITATYYVAKSYYENFANTLNSTLDSYSYPSSGNINTGVCIPFYYSGPDDNGEAKQYDNSMYVNIGYCGSNDTVDNWIETPSNGCYSSDGIIVVNKENDFKYGINKWHIGAKFIELYKKFFA